MGKYYFWLLFLIFCNNILAQNIIENSGFQYGNDVPFCFYPNETQNSADDFDSRIYNWKSARKKFGNFWTCIHGCIPSVDWRGTSDCSYIEPLPAIPGNRYVFFANSVDYPDYHEGVIQALGQYLDPNKLYTIRLIASSPNSDAELKIKFSKWGNTTGSDKWYSSNSNNVIETVWNVSGFNGIDNNGDYYWQNFINENIAVSSSDLDNIIVIQQKGHIFVDMIELYETCPDILRIENHNYFIDEGIIKAENYIYAGYDVGATTTNGNVIVSSTGSVRYQAGEAVILQHGFRTEGGYFHAYNAPCSAGSKTDYTSESELVDKNQLSENDINLYPNPAKENITIEFNTPAGNNVSISITDISGKIIFTRQYPHIGYHLKENISFLKSGMYYVKVICENGEYHKKLIIN